MLEYRTDASKILKAAGGTSNEELSKFFIYAGNDGIQYLVEQDTFKNTLFPGSVAADNYFPGQDGEKYFNYQTINANYGDPVLGEEIGFNRQVRLSNESTKRITNFMKVGTILKSDDYNNIVANTELYNSTGLTIEEAKHGYRSAKLFHDTIRIYLATGYVLNSISGLNVKVSVPINKALYFYSDDTMDNTTYNIRYRNVNSKLYLLNWYLPKEMMKDNDSDGNPYIHWLASPLYMNSRFFDRYIEIKVPAPRSLYINESLYKDSIDDLQKYKDYIKNIGVDYVYSHEKPNGDILYYHGVPEKNSMINIEVATVSNDYLDFLDNETSNYYECTFNTDPTKVISLSGVSITNMFNA